MPTWKMTNDQNTNRLVIAFPQGEYLPKPGEATPPDANAAQDPNAPKAPAAHKTTTKRRGH